MRQELVIPKSPSPSTLPARDGGTSLTAWLIAYCHAEVAGAPRTTLQAKKRDFELFLGYFATMMRSDAIDDWTRSVTLGFVQWLENEGNKGEGYAPTSVNRTMATLRRAVRWIQDRRPFLAGDPFERVSDLAVTVPPAKGLSPLQRRRILAAADKLVGFDRRMMLLICGP
jgi:integrase/recombinase XerD